MAGRAQGSGSTVKDRGVAEYDIYTAQMLGAELCLMCHISVKCFYISEIFSAIAF